MRMRRARELRREEALSGGRRVTAGAYGSDRGTSVEQQILRLQRLAGNAAVTHLLTKGDAGGFGAMGTIEDMEGEELVKASRDQHRLPVKADLSLGLAAVDDAAGAAKSDAVKEHLGIDARVVNGGPEPKAGNFGEERAKYKVIDTDFKESGGAVEIKSTVFLDITWNTHAMGRTDVTGSDSAAVTADTFGDVVKDLKPNASGRPRRRKYWASDLTSKHEKFHVKDDIGQAKLYLPTLKAWLNSQTVTADRASVATLVEQARAKIQADGWDHYNDGGEDRAYADGKASYQDRVDAVTARADKEGWE